MSLSSPLPSLPYDAWAPTKASVHLVAQLMGKVKLLMHPKQPHWWHATLRLSPRGVTTGTIPVGDRNFEVELQIPSRTLVIATSDGAERRLALEGQSIAQLYQGLTSGLAELGHPVSLRPEPYDMPHSTTPFPDDHEVRPFEAQPMADWWRALRFIHDTFELFAGRTTLRTSPVHLFWHSFDMVVTRFSGRRSPAFGQGGRRSDVEAYTHEVVSYGWWPGDPKTPLPAFYAYAAPEPAGLAERPLAPEAAWWQALETSHLAMLKWEDVASAEDPRQALLSFMQSFWDAASTVGDWPEVEHGPTAPLWDTLDKRFPFTRGRERRG